jgi:two-component system sensor histidine kinase and response regulator WspE
LREVGGAVHVTTTPGAGTQFHLRVPVSRSVLRSLIVVIAGEPHALPLSRVDRLLRVAQAEIRLVEDRPYIVVDERNVALVAAAQILELDGAAPAGESLAVVVVADRGQRIGFVVDDFLGEQDLVVKPLDARLGRVADISAAAILADGAPVLIVDVEDLVRSVQRMQQLRRLAPLGATGESAATPPRRRRILVVDDSITVRELEKDLLSAQGYEVVTAVDGLAGWDAVRDSDFDLVITDVDMPRLDGIALTRSIKQDPKLREVPVIIMSYRGTLEDRQRGLAAAADLYVSKADYDDLGLLQAVVDLIGPALP